MHEQRRAGFMGILLFENLAITIAAVRNFGRISRLLRDLAALYHWMVSLGSRARREQRQLCCYTWVAFARQITA